MKICTLTLNPSLDYVVGLKKLIPGGLNRTAREALFPGGKGINVSQVLLSLGFPSRVHGFAAGFTGRELERALGSLGLETALVFVEGMTRINVKVHDEESGADTEINGAGPVITQAALHALERTFDDLEEGDMAVLSGNVPGSLPADLYAKLGTSFAARGVRVVVDAEGESLRSALCIRPYFIKPNRAEAEALAGLSIGTAAEAAGAARKLQALGAGNVCISLGGDGAVLVTEDGEAFSGKAPYGRAVNPIGAGDSMAAGLLAGRLLGKTWEEALRLGLCAGSATAFSTGLAGDKEIHALYSAGEAVVTRL